MKDFFIHMTFYILLPCCITTTSAQEHALPFYQHYGLKEGLPQIQITTLFQDSRGYIWAGTNNGIARFNGEMFFPFTARNGFPFSYVNSFTEDANARVWALCRHGISCISGDSIINYPSPEYLLGKMSHGHADTLWLSATRRIDDRSSLGYFVNGEYHFFDFKNEQQRFSRNISDIEYDRAGRKLFIADSRRVYSLNNGVLEVVNSPEMGEDYYLTNIIIKGDELVVAYTDIHRVETRLFRLYQNEYERIGILKDAFWEEPLPRNCKKDISFFVPSDDHFIENGEVYETNVPEHLIMAFLKDRDGTYWLGAERGLLRVLPGSFTNYNPALLPEVWSVTEHPEGAYWFGSFSFGLKTMRNDIISSVKDKGKEIGSHYFHPAVSEKGDIYFALHDGILKRSDDGAMKLLTYSQDNNSICFYTYYDSERNCLLGAFRGNVAVWDENDILIREIGRAGGYNLSGFVHCMAQDSTRNYWFGSPDIYFYNWESDSLKQYASSADIHNCLDIATDYSGTTWFGTQKGLYYYDRNADGLVHVDAPELQDWVLMVFPVDSGRLLLSQPDGLYVLDLDKFNRSGEYSFSVYNEANGYLGGEPGQAGAFKDSNGDIWITGSELLCRVNPGILPRNEVLSIQPLFTRCNNIPILYGQQEVRLPLNQKSATVVLDAISYNRPRPVAFQYRRDEDDDWSAPQNENYITFTNLPHGKTSLYVRASFQGLSGLVADNEQLLFINVRKSFYNQTWFTPLVFLLLLITLIAIIIVQGKTYSKMQKALTKARVAEVETIQMQMNPHFVYNVLASVHARIRNKRIEEAEEVLLKLSQLTRSFLHALSPQLSSEEVNIHNLGTDKNRLLQNRVSLEQELNLLQEFVDFQQILYPGTFVYLLKVDNEVDLDAVKIPPMLLQPFVENAISHGLIPKKSIGLLQVDIRSDRVTGRTIIAVIDDGIGIEQSEALLLLSKMRYPSRGRKLTMERIKLLNGLGFHIEVKTESSSAGTKITIEF